MIQWPLLRKELGRLALLYLLASLVAAAAWALLARAPLPLEPQTAGMFMNGAMRIYWLACLYIYLVPTWRIYRAEGLANAAVFAGLGMGTIYGIYALFLMGLVLAQGYASGKLK